MNEKVYKQADSRWGSMPYPTSNSPVSSDGCGLVAVTHCAIEVNQYKNLTPRDVQPYMKQFAVAGNGTRYANPDGIAKGMEHYGLKDVKKIDNMSDFWKELEKGDRVGIILFWGGYAPDGTLWTTGGHFVFFGMYSYEDGKHWLYTKDSGGRNRTGWYTYENSMKGRIGYLWTGRVPKTGWRKEGKYWYFYKNDTLAKNDWAKDSSKRWFYLGEDGKMVKNAWVKWKDDWYYLKDNGEMAENEWAKDSNGKWFYLGKGGKMLKGCWVRWKNNMYYLLGNGEMATGSRNVPCSFDKDGKLTAN